MTGEKSNAPRTSEYPTPGKSLALPPWTKTLLYLEHTYPIPGTRAVILKSLVNLTLATCREAEFGFLGLIVVTLLTIPFIWGRLVKAGVREKLISLYFLFLIEDCFKDANDTH